MTTDTNFNVAWNDRNFGAVTASGSWNDKVYFSTDNQIGNDTLLGTLAFNGSLAQNQSVSRNLNVNIPRNQITQAPPNIHGGFGCAARYRARSERTQ